MARAAAGSKRRSRPGQRNVLPEDDASGHLVLSIQARDRLPQQPVFRRALEGDLLRNRKEGGLRGESSVVEPPVAAGMDHPSGFGPAVAGWDGPVSGGGGDQHRPGPRGRFPEWTPGGADAGATAGELRADHRVVIGLVGGRVFEPHPGPVRVQFLCHQHGKGGGDPLPHLRAIHHHQHRTVTQHSDPGIRSEGSGSGRGRWIVTTRGEARANRERRPSGGRSLEKLPAPHLLPE